MIYGINHIAISTPNLERLAAFYCEDLGFEKVFKLNWDIGNSAYDNITGLRNSSARGLILKLGNACIELFEFKTPTPRPAIAMRPESALTACSSTPRLRPSRAGYGRDPDGNVIELLEIPADSSLAVVPARLAPA